MDTQERIKQGLKYLRGEGWTQVRMERESGVCQPIISNFLNGKKSLSHNAAQRLLDMLALYVKE